MPPSPCELVLTTSAAPCCCKNERKRDCWRKRPRWLGRSKEAGVSFVGEPVAVTAFVGDASPAMEFVELRDRKRRNRLVSDSRGSPALASLNKFVSAIREAGGSKTGPISRKGPLRTILSLRVPL